MCLLLLAAAVCASSSAVGSGARCLTDLMLLLPCQMLMQMLQPQLLLSMPAVLHAFAADIVPDSQQASDSLLLPRQILCLMQAPVAAHACC